MKRNNTYLRAAELVVKKNVGDFNALDLVVKDESSEEHQSNYQFVMLDDHTTNYLSHTYFEDQLERSLALLLMDQIINTPDSRVIVPEMSLYYDYLPMGQLLELREEQ